MLSQISHPFPPPWHLTMLPLWIRKRKLVSHAHGHLTILPLLLITPRSSFRSIFAFPKHFSHLLIIVGCTTYYLASFTGSCFYTVLLLVLYQLYLVWGVVLIPSWTCL